ncbi:MAG: ornithine carbamoyltransferase, partial [Candidatus Bathyarchaeia archaeon]
LMARAYRHEMLLDMRPYMTKPLIKGIGDRYHPCQVLGDLQTIREKKGRLEGLKLAYVGDGNNVCNSLIVGCSKVGMQVAVATPKGYEPLEEAVRIGGRLVHLGDDPKEACKDADVVYTDTWVSMGFEDERAKRLRDFKGFTVTRELLGDALFMHCLPVHRNEEASDEVIDSPQSIIFDQAENRLHMQKAILLWLLEKI